MTVTTTEEALKRHALGLEWFLALDVPHTPPHASGMSRTLPELRAWVAEAQAQLAAYTGDDDLKRRRLRTTVDVRRSMLKRAERLERRMAQMLGENPAAHGSRGA